MTTHRSVGLVLAVIAILVVAALAGRHTAGEAKPYATYTRPDGKFSIVVMRRKSWLPTMPGQGSDSPGEVQLMDAQGRVLKQADVEMVQLVDKVEWLDKSVSIKLIADWPLPE